MRWRHRRRAKTAALLIAVGLAVTNCSSDSEQSTGSDVGPATNSSEGQLAVGFRTETFVDPSRPTPPTEGVAAAPSRTLVTTIYYPAAGPVTLSAAEGAVPASDRGPFPLVLFSHGGGTTGTSYSNLLSRFAAAGYVVAAPNYLPSGGPTDAESRPADARFVITRVLALNGEDASPIHDLIDATSIGAIGHSMGGGITLGFAFNSCCLDGRVGAAVLLATAQPTYPGQGFPPPGVPALVIHGDADSRATYAGGLQLFADLRSPKYLLTILGGEHTPPFSGEMQRPESRLVVDATVAFLDLQLKGKAAAGDRLRALVQAQPLLATLEEA